MPSTATATSTGIHSRTIGPDGIPGVTTRGTGAVRHMPTAQRPTDSAQTLEATHWPAAEKAPSNRLPGKKVTLAASAVEAILPAARSPVGPAPPLPAESAEPQAV